MRSKKALIGRQSILDFLGISKTKFYGFIKEGLPVVKKDGQWTAHADQLDEWFFVDGRAKV